MTITRTVQRLTYSHTIGLAATAGANIFVAGTAVFGEGDYKAAIDLLRRNAQGRAG